MYMVLSQLSGWRFWIAESDAWLALANWAVNIVRQVPLLSIIRKRGRETEIMEVLNCRAGKTKH